MAVPFTITPTAGEKKFVIEPEGINGPLGTKVLTDLNLFGMNKKPYGEKLNTDLYRLLENFSCPEQTFSIESIPTTSQVVVNNDVEMLFSKNDSIEIVYSTNNNGSYTVDSSSYDGTTNQTTITLQSSTLDTSVADGSIGYPGVPQDERTLGKGNGINKPLKGQLWYNSTTGTIYVYKANNYSGEGIDTRQYLPTEWVSINKVETGNTEPTQEPEQGYLWYDTANNQLNVYDTDTGGWTSVAQRYVRLDGTSTMTGSLDLGSNKVINVTDPTDLQEAATKNYVDTELDNFVFDDLADATVASPSVDDGVYWDGSQWVNGHNFVLVSGDTITGALTVDGNLSTGGNFDATGTITSGGNGTINGDLSVSGDLTTGALTATADGTTLTYDGHAIWHAGNDGSGSGLDAELWDGAQKYVSTSDPTSTDGNDGDIWFKL